MLSSFDYAITIPAYMPLEKHISLQTKNAFAQLQTLLHCKIEHITDKQSHLDE